MYRESCKMEMYRWETGHLRWQGRSGKNLWMCFTNIILDSKGKRIWQFKMIIENDIQVWLALTIGVLYLAGKLEKRKYGIGGGIAAAAGMFLWLWIVDARMILFGNPMIYLAKYMMLYMLTVVVVYATYKCHLIVAVFYTTAAYCLQNGAAQVWAIFTDEKSWEIWGII